MDVAAVRVLRRHLRVIEREVERQLKGQTLCCGVTSAQCHVLLELADAGESSLVTLSERLKLDTSTLSRTVDGLVRTGYVDRITDPANRRYVLLGLTTKGKRKVDFIDRMSDRFYLELVGQVSKQRLAALMQSVELLAGIFAGKVCVANGAPAVRAGRERAGKNRG